MKLASSLVALTLATSALAQNAPSPKLIAQLDAASKNFKSAQADVQKDVFEYIVKDHTLTSGTIYIARNGSAATMGAVIYPEGSKAPSNIISFDGDQLQSYTTSTNQVDIFKAGANQAKYQSFLTLGFGGSGTDLMKAWNINDMGSEVVDNVKCEKLDLTPKDPSLAGTFTHITIWIDPARDVSLKQIFYAPNKNMQTAAYTNIKLNASINKKPYSIPSKALKSFH